MKHRTLAASLVAAAGFFASAEPSLAQYYPYPQPPPRPYYQPNPYYRPDPYGGGGYYQPRPVFGNLCVTSRGNCYTRPRPANSSCACDIPGFGIKRGAILAQDRGW